MNKIDFNPCDDEKKQFSMAEFVQIMKELIDDFGDDISQCNEWQSQTHTFDEWFGSFVRWKSW